MFENLGDPRKQAMLMLAAGLLSPVRGRGATGFGEALGNGIQGGLLGFNQASRTQEATKRGEMERRLQQMQLADMERQQKDREYASQIAPQFFSPGNAPSDGMGPAMPPKMDLSGYGMALAGRNPSMGLPYIQAGTKDNSPLTVKDGETILDRNTLKPLYQSQGKPHWVDMGNAIAPFDNSGKQIGPAIPKSMAPGEAQRIGMDAARLNLERGRYQYEVGDGQGLPQKQRDAISADVGKKRAEAVVQAQQDLPQTTAEAEQTIGLVDKMLSHPGFKTVVGAKGPTGAIATAGLPIPGTDAADFLALRDQLLGKQFMQAYQTLKGGGQITEVEGKKATDAISRMSTAQSEAAFKEAANEFKGVIRAGMMRAKTKAGVVNADSNPVQSGPKPGTVDGDYYFKGGDPADPKNWTKRK